LKKALTPRLIQRLEQALTQAWIKQGGWSGNALTCLLWPVSLIFRTLIACRWHLYKMGAFKQQTLSVPVIVVGNVMAGGVGKTPIVIALVQHLQAKGWRVGVLSRGYGRRTSRSDTPSTCEVTPTSFAQDVGDEPLLISRRCQVPVWVGSNRVLAGKSLLQQHPDVQVLVCDDGLQHWALGRDIEICVFDERGIGNGQLLPAGPLREPWPRKFLNSHAQSWTIKTADQAKQDEYVVHRQLANFAVQANGTKRLLASWGSAPVQALAGIAKPNVFFAMLREQGLNIQHEQTLADHADLREIQISPQWGDVFCTEKDAVKLWDQHPDAWAVPLETQLPETLLAGIDQALTRVQHAKLSSPNGHKTS
jgi:tetraacyldisaccharide 4'-kinase